jgi:hypothetical protein
MTLWTIACIMVKEFSSLSAFLPRFVKLHPSPMIIVRSKQFQVLSCQIVAEVLWYKSGNTGESTWLSNLLKMLSGSELSSQMVCQRRGRQSWGIPYWLFLLCPKSPTTKIHVKHNHGNLGKSALCNSTTTI